MKQQYISSILHKDPKLSEDLKQLKHLGDKDEELIEKLNEFMVLLDRTKLDSENIKQIQNTINKVIDTHTDGKTVLSEIQHVSTANLEKFDQLDQLELLLNTNVIDSKQAHKILFRNRFLKFIKIIIGFLFVTLGFAMIIMPAPPYFEMFTIFYFNPNDGVTLMDLISLIIVVVGIYIIVKSISNIKSHE